MTLSCDPGGLPYIKCWGCSSEILKMAPKRYLKGVLSRWAWQQLIFSRCARDFTWVLNISWRQVCVNKSTDNSKPSAICHQHKCVWLSLVRQILFGSTAIINLTGSVALCDIRAAAESDGAFPMCWTNKLSRNYRVSSSAHAHLYNINAFVCLSSTELSSTFDSIQCKCICLFNI